MLAANSAPNINRIQLTRENSPESDQSVELIPLKDRPQTPGFIQKSFDVPLLEPGQTLSEKTLISIDKNLTDILKNQELLEARLAKHQSNIAANLESDIRDLEKCQFLSLTFTIVTLLVVLAVLSAVIYFVLNF